MNLAGLRLNVATAEIFKCDPRLLLVTPTQTFHQIHASAEEKANKTRNKLKSRGHVKIQFVKQILVPFWHFNCRSLIAYDRPAVAEIALHESNVTKVHLRDESGKELVFTTNGAKKAHVNVTESCEIHDGVEGHIDNVPSGRWNELKDSLVSFGVGNVSWKDYRLSNPKEILDVERFLATGEYGDEYLHLGYRPHRPIHIQKPAQSAESIIQRSVEQLSKILSRKDIVPTRIVFSIETLDLYYRPLFVFEFSQLHNMAKEEKKQLLSIDGVTGEWSDSVVPTLNPFMNNDVRSAILVTTEIIGEFLKSSSKMTIIPVEIGKKIVRDALDKE